MPIEGIIDGLRECTEKYSADHTLAQYVKDAIELLTSVDNKLEEAFQEGKRVCIEEMLEEMLD